MKIAWLVFWEGIRWKIQEYVHACEVCQIYKYQTLLVQLWFWSDISVDFIVGLPKALVVDTVMVVVDGLTNYAHCMGSQTLLSMTETECS